MAGMAARAGPLRTNLIKSPGLEAPRCLVLSLLLMSLAVVGSFAQPLSSPPGPFEPDAHTLLLYHFDEGHGHVARDASGHGYDGELRGPQWAPGRFGTALEFDGEDDSVFRLNTEAIRGLKQLTVECWFTQEMSSGRRFLAGQDVGFHFEVDDGTGLSISLYNQGGGVPNAEGEPHRQVAIGVGPIRPGRWHHDAITYDGEMVSFFLDGVLRQRVPGPKDFSLGVPSRGLWIGCYVGTDFWFSGRIDEFRISDCIRYDPQRKLKPGERVFDMPQTHNKPLRPPNVIRTPQRTGEATLHLTLTKRHGGNTAGRVYLKPPGQPAVIVGEYALRDLPTGAQASFDYDASDELAGSGRYLLGLEQTDASGYLALTAASLTRGANPVARWEGEVLSRRTFSPPLLAALQVGEPPSPTEPTRILLLPTAVDRAWGGLELDDSAEGQPPCMVGDGYAEWWLDIPAAQTYRLYMRYAGSNRPCDIVMDGDDLNQYDMCATNSTGRSHPRDAFWEYQGTTTLSAGPHWLRVQDVLPDIVALRLDPAPAPAPAKVPWQRFPVPNGDFLCQADTWEPAPLHGAPAGAQCALRRTDDLPALFFSARFTNTNPGQVFAGDAVRLAHRGQWDLEPFGRLAFRFAGRASGHVVSLWLVDAKGDEKLLWRERDREPVERQIAVPISFEGNDVFDPGHVVAVCLDLDEGNIRADQVNELAGAIIAPIFERRDVLVPSDDLSAEAREAARATMLTVAEEYQPPRLLSPGFRPWTKPVVPEEHPLYAVTEPKPVTRAVLGYNLHFTGARSIQPQTLDDFHKFYDFGDICWPHIGILPMRRNYTTDEDYQRALVELERRLQDVRDRGLILWDIWGYVPYNEAGPTPHVAPEHHATLLRVLGDRFLGYDNGEQDGRYIGSYADRGPHTNRKEGWEDFVRWDTMICDDSMHYMNATGSLNFSHYYGERGCRTLGLETAQGLPSDTLMFAFLRGASKQYGRLTTQATSIWNRFGYNMYHDRRTDGPGGYGLGPHKGCSLSLHKRLFFQSYLGGDSIVGTETSQFTADRLDNGAPELSPLGRQHLEIKRWVEQHPDRGVMYTPIAFMLDFYNGWNMPRHLYRGDKYKIWGKLPYEKGDYLIDAIFRMIWPGYEDCSYLRNERGFITPTPFGDIFDVLTNRCHPQVLQQYTAIMLLGNVEMTPEVVQNLTGFVQAGGDLILDAHHAQALPQELTGVTLGGQMTGHMSCLLPARDLFDELPYTYTVLTPTTATPLLLSDAGHPLMTLNQAGQGRVIVGAVDYWMTDKLTYKAPELVNMEPPYRLLKGVQAALEQYFGSFSPVTTEPPGLNIRTCCFAGDPKHLLVGLTNNELFADWEGTLRLRVGQAAEARELRTDRNLPAGEAIALTVPAGDVAIVDIRLK